MSKTIKYDKQSYERYLNEVQELENQLEEAKQELATADRRVIDGWLRTSEADLLTQRVMRLQEQLTYLRSKKIEVIDATEESSTIAIGHIYHTLIKSTYGETNELTFKLVEENPRIGIPGEIAELSIKSPIGASIYGKNIGETYEFTVPNQTGTGKIKVLEEVHLQSTDENEF